MAYKLCVPPEHDISMVTKKRRENERFSKVSGREDFRLQIADFRF
jgi:hypothetical protein